MKGLAIIGSAQLGSHTHALSQYLQGQFEEHDVELEIFELAKILYINLILQGQHKRLKRLKIMLIYYKVRLWKRISSY